MFGDGLVVWSQLVRTLRSVHMVGVEVPLPQVVLVVQRFGVGLVIERSLAPLPAGALSSQISLPSLRGR